METQSDAVMMHEIVYSNILAINALIEVLSEKGIVAKNEVLDRIRKLQIEGQKKRQKKDQT